MEGYPASSPETKEETGWSIIRGDDATQTLEGRETPISGFSSFEDAAFPADPASIHGLGGGSDASSRAQQQVPECRCGLQVIQATMKKEGASKGRRYWRCGVRRCSYFHWVGRLELDASQMWWQRFPGFVLVGEAGFRAEDLVQGAIGDCWFLSALAVVAERPDLVARLFGGRPVTPADGCYEIRLFLDGVWRTIAVDDRLPCTGKQKRPDGSSLAFGRTKSDQLWGPILEKAYAKAYGSYKAISGGQVAEALHHLTGCPTETIDLDAKNFDPRALWANLLEFRAQGFPMGCGTAENPELAEVGLCGYHAYSILDVREVTKPDESGVTQLLRIRNPHGVGEWNREWSDASVEWTESISSELGRTGVDDGTFWMDYIHFLMAFEVIDVCYANRDFHSLSFQSNAFCPRSDHNRLCRHAYRIQVDSPTTLYAMALQPSKRGTWGRQSRQRYYKPGDVSLLVVSEKALSDNNNNNTTNNNNNTNNITNQQSAVLATSVQGMESLVSGQLCGASTVYGTAVCAHLEPGTSYLLLVFCLGAGPTAAEGGSHPEESPFCVRFCGSQPIKVRPLASA
ncbi:unnamed protein product, partial [Polarella glacialis]